MRLIPERVLCHGVESHAVKPKQILIICGCSSTSTFKTCLALGLLCVQISKSCRSYWFQLLTQTLPSKSTIFPQKPLDSWHLPRSLAMFWSPSHPIPLDHLTTIPQRLAGHKGVLRIQQPPVRLRQLRRQAAVECHTFDAQQRCEGLLGEFERVVPQPQKQPAGLQLPPGDPPGVKRSRNIYWRNWMMFQV